MERLQKIISQAGIASRRAAEKMIEEGRVTVDGVVATLGAQADADSQTICVDGQPICRAEAHVVTEGDGTHTFIFTDGVYGFSVHLKMQGKWKPVGIETKKLSAETADVETKKLSPETAGVETKKLSPETAGIKETRVMKDVQEAGSIKQYASGLPDKEKKAGRPDRADSITRPDRTDRAAGVA